MTRLTVSDVRTALSCPRLFYLGFREGAPTFVARAGRGIAVGRWFHEALAGLAAWGPGAAAIAAALEGPPARLGAGAVSEVIEHLVYEREVDPVIRREEARLGRAGELLETLWASVRSACRVLSARIVANRAFYAPAEAVGQTLMAGELEAEEALDGAAGRIEIAGRLDAVLYDRARKEIAVVEYKTAEALDPEIDVAQVALYAYLLRATRAIEATSAVLYFLPEAREVRMAPERLEAALGRLFTGELDRMAAWSRLAPAEAARTIPGAADRRFCEFCPSRARCEERFGVRTAEVAPRAAPSPPSIEGAARLEKLAGVLADFGIGVAPLGFEVGPSFIRLRIQPEPPKTVRSIQSKAGDLMVHMDLEAPPIVQAQAGHVSVDIQRRDREAVPLLALLEEIGPPDPARATFPVGRGVGGAVTSLDLADSNSCHVLIAGATGSGKSVFLRSVVVALAHRRPPERMRIAIIDPKKVSFTRLAPLPHLYRPVVTEVEGAIDLFRDLVAEMERRYDRLGEARVEDVGRLPPAEAPPRIAVVFDEFADFLLEKEARRALEETVTRLVQKARAAGIHVILATQRPDHKVAAGLIKANLPGRIALRTASEIDSRIILDDPSAAHLLGKGDLLVAPPGRRLIRVQAPHMDDDDLSAWVEAQAAARWRSGG